MSVLNVASGVSDTTSRQVVFIQDTLNNWQQLLSLLPTSAEVVMLDGRSDGLTQMATYLSSRHAPVDAIHVLSHGAPGLLELGSLTLTANNLAQHTSQLEQIGKTLTENGDLLLYGCDVAAGPDGVALVQHISAITQADVAASSDLTGYAALGGNWVLENRIGQVTTAELAFTDYMNVLATLNSGFATGFAYSPNDIVVDSQNNLYVAVFGSSAVYKFPASSGVITGGAIGSAFISGPSTALVIDSTGNLYVGSSGVVTLYAANSGIPGSSGSAIGSSFNNVSDLVFAADGTMYVADSGSGQVYKIDNPGGVFTTASASASASVAGAQQIYIDAANNLYIVSRTAGKVIKFAASGGVVSLGSPSDFITGVTNPRALSSDGVNFYVSSDNGTNGDLYKFGSTGGAATPANIENSSVGGKLNQLFWAGSNALYATLTDKTVVKITLTGGNSAPTDLTLSASSVAENTSTASALTIGALTSTDPDSGNTFTYSIIGGDDQGSFQVSGNNLQFKAGTVLDYEAKSSYTVTVQTTDQGGLTYDKALTVNVSNVNEKPAITAPAAQNVNQAAATAITGISLLDPDAGTNSIALTLAAATGTLTASNGSGVIVSNSGTASIILNGTQANLNSFISTSKVSYTSAAGATGNVTLTISSDDGGNSGSGGTQADSKTETLNIALPSTAVMFTGDAGNTNSPNATVATTPTTSVAITNTATSDTLNMAISGGVGVYQDTTVVFTGLGMTMPTGSSGMVVVTADNTDINSITLTVQGGKVFDFMSMLLMEAGGVGEVMTFTPNGNVANKVTYGFTGGETQTVNLSANTNFDNLTSLRISSNDGSFQANFDNIQLENIGTAVNSAPTNLALSASSVAENTSTASALTIGALSSTDPDTGNTFTYSVVGGVDQTSFQVSGTNLQFKAGTVLDYETKNSYAVTVRTTDQGGLTYDKALTVSLTDVNETPADTTPPDTSITSNPSSVSNSSSANFNFTGTDDNISPLSYEVSLDGGSYAAGTSPKSYTGLTDGSHTFNVRAVDGAGNQDATPATYTWTVDTTAIAPTLALVADTGSSNSDGKTSNAQVNVSGLESGATWQYSTNNGTNWTTGTGTNFTLTGDGAKSVVVRQTDAAGNVSSSSSALAFTLDTTASTPTLALSADTGSSNSDRKTSNGQVNVSGLESGATWQYSTNNGSIWTTGTGTNFTLTGDGAKSVIVRQTDVAGNVSANSSAKAFTLDTTAPTYTITANDLNAPTGSDFSFDIQYADSGSGWDGATFDLSNVTVTGPSGIGALPMSSGMFNGITGLATYTVQAPHSGSWNSATDAGTYTIAINGNSFKDFAGNAVAAVSAAKTFVVSFGSSNAAPTNIALSASSVAENTSTASALTIGSLTSTDPDTGNTFTYSIQSGADQASFQIGAGNNLQFKAGTVLDYEAKSSYAVTVRTTDQGGLTYDKALTVNVSNVNEKPAITAPAAQNVNQAAATAITGISLLDPDAGSNSITLTLAAATGTLTASNGGGVIVSNSGTASIILNGTQASLNSFISTSKVSYTSAVGANGNVTLTISSDDGGNSGSGGIQTDNKTETLTIVPLVIPPVPPVIPPVVPPVIPPTPAPVNEAPTAIELQNATTRLPENTSTANALKVADIHITDDALGSNTLTLSGADAGNFQLIGNALFLKAGTVLDFETQASYQLNIQANDTTLPASSPVSTTFTLNLSNIVETSQKPASNAPATLPAVATWNTLSDKDGDGSPEQLEDYVTALNVTGAIAGDGNGDGQLDSLQNSVNSMPFLKTATAVSAPGNATSTFLTLVADSLAGKPDTTDDNTAQLRSAVQKDAPANLPADMKMPLGQIQFAAVVSQKGQSETFSLYLDNELNINGYWAKNATGVWVNLASAPYGGQMVNEGGKLRLDFKITDGGEFDTDGKPDGVIIDVGAVAAMPVSLAGQAPVIPGLAAGFWF